MPVRQSSIKRCRGFTLTEAAIVLGIVGLILGAIWVAAASVYGNMRVKRGSEQLLTIAQNVRQLMATSTQFGGNPPANTGTNITVGMLNKNVFPTDVLNAAGTATITPWMPNVVGGVPNGGNIRVTVGPNTASQFIVSFRFNNQGGAVSGGQRDCAAFLAANLRIGPVQIWDGNGNGAWVAGANASPETVLCGTPPVALAGANFYGAHFAFDLR